MLATVLLEIAILVILAIINGLLSMSELSIISSRKARLKTLADGGDTKAATALELAEAPDRMLSTVQVGITLMGILSGAFGGAQLAEILSGAMQAGGMSEGLAETLSLVIIVLGITYLSLVIGELVPKRIALYDPESAARRLAKPISVLSRVVSPLVTVLSASTNAVLKLIGMDKAETKTVTEEEVQLLIDEGTKSGVFEEEERTMVGSIFRMSDLGVKDLMTPRRDIDWLDMTAPGERIIEVVARSPHTLFPVGEGSLDNSIGMVKAKDLLQQVINNKPIDLSSIVRAPVMIPETATAFQSLNMLREARSPMGLVVDEYGGIDGLVTQTDLLAAIAGDMEQIPVEDVVIREDGSYLLDGSLPIDRFWEVSAISMTSRPEQEHYHTVAGLVLSHLGRIPRTGDTIQLDGHIIEVIDMDGKRIDKLLVRRSVG